MDLKRLGEKSVCACFDSLRGQFSNSQPTARESTTPERATRNPQLAIPSPHFPTLAY